MTPQVLLESLRSLLEEMPPLEGKGRYSHEQFAWIGKAGALLHEWDPVQSVQFKAAANGLIRNIDRSGNYGVLVSFMHDVVARLENSLPKSDGQAFGPGAAYDFFVALNDLVASASSSLLIIDPYLDAQVFDGYLHGLKPGLAVRLLTTKFLDNIRVAAEKFRAQVKSSVELRHSIDIHDRVVLIDNDQCWVLGSSIKDAALKKPTYLAPLARDVAEQKRLIYEAIWSSATPI